MSEHDIWLFCFKEFAHLLKSFVIQFCVSVDLIKEDMRDSQHLACILRFFRSDCGSLLMRLALDTGFSSCQIYSSHIVSRILHHQYRSAAACLRVIRMSSQHQNLLRS